MSPYTKRLCVLAQWSANQDLPPHVRIHLERLRPHCDRLVLVSNSPLDTSARVDAEQLCDGILERENTGFDFAAWRDALRHEDLQEYDELLLTNSSIIGPLFGLDELFKKMESRACDFWGLTFSREITFHLQSYFLVFRKKALQSDTWWNFWSEVGNETEKDSVVSKSELNLYDALDRGGLTGDAYVTLREFATLRRAFLRRLNTRLPLWLPSDRRTGNPTLYAPKQIIELGVPYLKASLAWGRFRRMCPPLAKIKALPGVDYPWREVGL